MIPVRQTIFVATDPKGRGNCMAACLASLLEIPLHSAIDTTSDACRADWEGSIGRWLADRGLKLEDIWPDESEPAELADAYSIGSGPSPRGPFWHAVVCKSGRMVFDPHPSDDGLVSLERHQRLAELTATEMQLHAIGALFPVRRRLAA